MKKAELVFSALLVPLDYIMLLAAGLTAYALRFRSSVVEWQPVLYTIPFNQYVVMLFITAAVWLVIFAVSGMYHIRSNRRLVEETRKIFLGCSTSVLLIIILFFFNRDLFSSRFIILAGFIFSLLYVTVARVAVIYIERWLFRKGIGVHNVVLVGDTRVSTILMQEMERKRGLGFQVQLRFDRLQEDAQRTISDYYTQGLVDELLLAEPNATNEQIEEAYEFCDNHHIAFKYAAALMDTQFANMTVQPIAGIPIVELKNTPLDGWGRIVKRLFDIIASAVLIIITFPVMLVTALAVYIDSGRPIFFSRRDDGRPTQRIGQYDRPFFYFKFRTMIPNSDSLRYHTQLQEMNVRKGSPLVKIVNDPRITRIGAFLRRFSIDELPEFFLVLKGNMSLVGPRPHLPEEVAQYKKHHRRVLHMKPGITGLAQISGRSDLDFEQEVRLDTFYMENWNLWLDLVILLKTPFVLFKNRKTL